MPPKGTERRAAAQAERRQAPPSSAKRLPHQPPNALAGKSDERPLKLSARGKLVIVQARDQHARGKQGLGSARELATLHRTAPLATLHRTAPLAALRDARPLTARQLIGQRAQHRDLHLAILVAAEHVLQPLERVDQRQHRALGEQRAAEQLEQVAQLLALLAQLVVLAWRAVRPNRPPALHHPSVDPPDPLPRQLADRPRGRRALIVGQRDKPVEQLGPVGAQPQRTLACQRGRAVAPGQLATVAQRRRHRLEQGAPGLRDQLARRRPLEHVDIEVTGGAGRPLQPAELGAEALALRRGKDLPQLPQHRAGAAQRDAKVVEELGVNSGARALTVAVHHLGQAPQHGDRSRVGPLAADKLDRDLRADAAGAPPARQHQLVDAQARELALQAAQRRKRQAHARRHRGTVCDRLEQLTPRDGPAELVTQRQRHRSGAELGELEQRAHIEDARELLAQGPTRQLERKRRRNQRRVGKARTRTAAVAFEQQQPPVRSIVVAVHEQQAGGVQPPVEAVVEAQAQRSPVPLRLRQRSHALGQRGGHAAQGSAGWREQLGAPHPSSARSRASASFISASLMISGGSSLIVTGPVALITSRCSSNARRASSPAGSRRPSRSKASIRPRPRTEATPGSSASAPRSSSPLRRTSASSCRSEQIASASSAAAHATGPPAKVDPWSPGRSTSASRGPVMRAPTGRPPPSALALVSASGTTPLCSYAQSVPVRPIPVWISSKISAAPTRSQASRAAASSSLESGSTPDSPWIGSSSTAAVRSPTAAASAAGSFSATTKPGTSGANGACLDSWGVADSAPKVRPWKASRRTTISPPGRARRASLIAASFASAPELQRNTLPPSELRASAAESLSAGSV